jgi:acyl transferase domain-containing protein
MKKLEMQESNDIAVISMSCYFPDAESPEIFWENLEKGNDSIIDIPASRQSDHFYSHIHTKKGSFIQDPYLFDNEFFRIGKEEAAIMDPQQRMLLELAVIAIKKAGFQDLKKQPVGIFIGATQQPYAQMLSSDYYRRNTIKAILDSGILNTVPIEGQKALRSILDRLDSPTPQHPSMLVGNILNMLASRISHELNLTGPSLAIDTACSSSLVAIHLACGSISRNECEMALAGGINLNLSPSIYQYLEIAGAVSPSGNSRPFSMHADGMVLGEGGGLILLKKASKALEDGNPVLAILKGSGINNDGRSMGIMAPNPGGQLALLEKVYRECGYDRRKISYIEAHGTGTRIGDALEINTIRSFFGPSPDGLSLGSVKSNIGHLLGAAGIAGFIKVVLSLLNQNGSWWKTISGYKPIWKSGNPDTPEPPVSIRLDLVAPIVILSWRKRLR